MNTTMLGRIELNGLPRQMTGPQQVFTGLPSKDELKKWTTDRDLYVANLMDKVVGLRVVISPHLAPPRMV